MSCGEGLFTLAFLQVDCSNIITHDLGDGSLML